MDYNLNVSQEVEDDMFDVCKWHEQQRVGLGEEFLNAVDDSTQILLQNPKTYRVSIQTKHKSLSNTSFSIYYFVLGRKERCKCLGSL